MSSQLITTKSLMGMRAVTQAKGKKIGKVRHYVFHPSQKRVIGLLIRRPDAALMFHRKDLFVALNGFHVEDGQLIVHDEANATDRAAIKALGVDWDTCVIWVGKPVVTESGDFLGYVDVVTFDNETGAVHSFTVEGGAANDVIVGKKVVPAHMARGFKRGTGMALVPIGQDQGEDMGEEQAVGAIIVSDEVAELSAQGGAAAAAGKATAIVADKAKKGASRAKQAASTQAKRAAPTAQKVAKATGEAVDAGTFAVGKQLGRASGMFAAFK